MYMVYNIEHIHHLFNKFIGVVLIKIDNFRGMYWIKILRDFKRLFNYEKVL